MIADISCPECGTPIDREDQEWKKKKLVHWYCKECDLDETYYILAGNRWIKNVSKIITRGLRKIKNKITSRCFFIKKRSIYLFIRFLIMLHVKRPRRYCDRCKQFVHPRLNFEYQCRDYNYINITCPKCTKSMILTAIESFYHVRRENHALQGVDERRRRAFWREPKGI